MYTLLKKNSNKKNKYPLLRVMLRFLPGMLLLLQSVFGLLVPGSPGTLSGLQSAAAQTSNENWTTPINLSRSGAATNPDLLVDSSGVFHAIWQDEFAGNFYTSGDGVQWAPPNAVTVPFAGRQPLLRADSLGFVHAFWLDEENNLAYSRARLDTLATGGAWGSVQRLATSAMGMDVAVGADERLHLAVLQSLDLAGKPSGVYYLRSAQGGIGWSTPALLYESPYFRSLTLENANIDIAATETEEGERLYAAWDNPSRERVYATRSLDAGRTWDPALEVDAPEDGSVAAGPARISVNAFGSNVLLIWQTNLSESSCLQHYQWSVDGGANWQPRERMLEDLPGCPQQNQVMLAEGGTPILATMVNNQVYLLAWNGSLWSSPQLQGALTGFVDPDTFKPVRFGCRQLILAGGQNLYAINCDTGAGGDIWITSRLLTDVSEWFSDAPLWQAPSTLVASPGEVLTPALVADSEDRVHVFWSQADSPLDGGPGTMINYSRLEAGQWSKPVAILSPPEGIAEHPSAAVDGQGNLLLVWSGGQSGQIYFSQASAARAVVATAWSEPRLLPSPVPAGSSPDILVDNQGKISVVYAIPLNEQRGVYLTQSADGGETWSEAVRVFDAIAAGWAMVDNPDLASTENGQMHLIWTRFSIPSGTGPLGLYYARSADSGLNWSQPVAVVETPVIWSRIIGVNNLAVHRVWQELSSGRTTLWHEQSLDGGTTWKRIAPVSIFGDTIGEPALASDQASRLHLLQAVSRGNFGVGEQSITLQHWVYEGESWKSEQSLDLSGLVGSELKNLVSLVSTEGELSVSFSAPAVNAQSGQSEDRLYFSSRLLQLPESLPTPLPPVTPAPVITSTPTPSPQPTATPTQLAPSAAGPVDQLPQQPNRPGNVWLGSVVGLVVAGVIVTVVFIIGVRRFGPVRR